MGPAPWEERLMTLSTHYLAALWKGCLSSWEDLAVAQSIWQLVLFSLNHPFPSYKICICFYKYIVLVFPQSICQFKRILTVVRYSFLSNLEISNSFSALHSPLPLQGSAFFSSRTKMQLGGWEALFQINAMELFYLIVSLQNWAQPPMNFFPPTNSSHQKLNFLRVFLDCPQSQLDSYLTSWIG